MGHRRKTRSGRLAQLDSLLLSLAGEVLERRDGPFGRAPVVDLGLGARPWTTEEFAASLAVPVVGVDRAFDVVARAQQHARPGLFFVVGSYDLPVMGRLVRVMNVLRDLWPHQVPAAHARLGRSVLDGGIVVEGSCGPTGEVGTAHWMQRRGDELVRQALLFWLDGSRGTSPLLFRDRLPSDLRRDLEHPVRGLFQRWAEAHGRVDRGPRRLERSVADLGDRELVVVGPGAAMWTPEGGVPRRVSAG